MSARSKTTSAIASAIHRKSVCPSTSRTDAGCARHKTYDVRPTARRRRTKRPIGREDKAGEVEQPGPAEAGPGGKNQEPRGCRPEVADADLERPRDSGRPPAEGFRCRRGRQPNRV